jgi:hypothetical protein
MNNASLFMTDSRMEETKYAGPQSQNLRKISNKNPLPTPDDLTDDFTERQTEEHDRNPSLDQKVSSNGGFSLARHGKKEQRVSLELVKLSLLRIVQDDQQRSDNKNHGDRAIGNFELRDVLSAKVEEADKRVLHIWTFKPRLEKKGCCCRETVRTRTLQVIQSSV